MNNESQSHNKSYDGAERDGTAHIELESVGSDQENAPQNNGNYANPFKKNRA